MEDRTLLQTVQNGLMIAGHEMGSSGDHWPAIHAIASGLEEEFAAMHRNEAVVGELEFHIADLLRQMEETAKQAPTAEQPALHQFLQEAWSRYYAVLEPVAAAHEPHAEDLVEDDDPRFIHMQAAAQIISNLSGRVEL